MNQKISTRELQRACRELLAATPQLSGRSLRAALKQRFGSAGKTDRVYAIWRGLRAERNREDARTPEQAVLAAQLEEARQQLALLQTALFDAEQRALRSEERERIHQDRWAMQIYELRQQLRAAGLAPAGEG